MTVRTSRERSAWAEMYLSQGKEFTDAWAHDAEGPNWAGCFLSMLL